MNMKIDMNNGFEGCYGGYTTSTRDFVESRRAGMERAIAFAEEERRNQGNG